jgi:hypothetical protein
MTIYFRSAILCPIEGCDISTFFPDESALNLHLSDPYGHNLGNDETAETDENEEVAQIPPAKKPKYYLESGTISCSTEGCTDEFIRKSAHLRHLVLHHEIELKKARRMADCRAF